MPIVSRLGSAPGGRAGGPRTGRTWTGACAPLLAGFYLAGCSLAPKPSVPEGVDELPAGIEEPSPNPPPYEPLEWWKAFADPRLDAVVDSVLASNFGLAEAVARVEQARLAARIAKAAFYPQIQAAATAEDSDLPTNASIGSALLGSGGSETDDSYIPFALPERLALTTYSLSLGFAYEVDFWGRARNEAGAAGAQYLASESDYHAARIGILSETIGTYFEIIGLRRQTALAREIAEVLAEREELARARYARGLTESLEVYRWRQDLHAAQAVVPALERQLASAEGRLSVLLGGFREGTDAILPDAPRSTPVADSLPGGIPADLLLQRPDVRAARHRLEAARFQVGARRAELLPTLSLSGSIGVQSTETTDLFNPDQWFRNLVANLVGPIVDGGRRRANVELAHARFDEAAAAYGRVVVTAVNEVEAALVGLREEERRSAFLAARLEEARQSSDLQELRYEAGIARYGDYLDALLARLNVGSARVAAERDLALARLAVHRALGGSWTEDTRKGDDP